jgi:8-oxo-dGTP pyrophosphatase MutT (NUDIX family)
VSEPSVSTVGDGTARIAWSPDENVDVIRREVAAALLTHHRVEALVDPDDASGQRLATWAGLQREGVARGVAGGDDRVVYARLASDVPTSDPEGFRTLLNSFLPRKRGISQLLVRAQPDEDGTERVLLCQLTYKRDWDLPGGVIEVGESPRTGAAREVQEELALDLPVGELLLTDWLPAWSGWDDALCLVYDGGVHHPSVLDAVVKQQREIAAVEFCTPAQVAERAADFTARRIVAALARAHGRGPAYTESGRPLGDEHAHHE